jgi:hypothetical protein
MKKSTLLSALLLPLSAFIPGQSKAQSKSPDIQSIAFTENKGQIVDQFYRSRPDILYSGSDGAMCFFLKKDGVSYQFNQIQTDKASENAQTRNSRPATKLVGSYRLDARWIGTNAACNILSSKKRLSVDNYYNEQFPNGLFGVESFGEVTYQNIYDGIGLRWAGGPSGLKYEYLLNAGADYRKIKIEISGATSISSNKEGELVIEFRGGKLTEQKPVVTQGNRVLKANWAVDKNIVSFDIVGIDPGQALLIDPLIRAWGTYFGGTVDDYVANSSHDNQGNVYVCGDTKSTTNIATTGAFQTTYAGGTNFGDALLAKYSSSGVRLWSTYFGSADSDYATYCFSDGTNIYMTGGTNATNSLVIPTPGAYQVNPSGTLIAQGLMRDAFLAKFDPAGMRIWSTFYGGNDSEKANGGTCDASGNPYITGSTSSTVNIASTSAHQVVYLGNYDAFIVKFDPSGNRQWASYYGGSGTEFGIDVAADALKNVYMCGYTQTSSSTVIATPSAYQTAFGGGMDALLVKFDSLGSRVWGTYYGGTGLEIGFSVCTDLNNNIYFFGNSSGSGTIMTTPGSHQPAYGGAAYDHFIAQFNAAGQRQWGTYYGGNGNENVGEVTTDNINIYIAGATSSKTGTAIATPCTYQDKFGGGATDAYIAKFTLGGTRIWGTYYGGISSEDYIYLSSNGPNRLYLSGITSTTLSGVVATPGSDQNIYGGGLYDGFLVRFDSCMVLTPSNTSVPAAPLVCYGETATLTTDACGAQWYTLPTGGSSIFTGTTFTAQMQSNTTYYIEESSCGTTSLRTAVNVIVAGCVGLTEQKEKSQSIKIYPNPGTGIFKIEKNGVTSLLISDNLGRKIKTISLDENEDLIDLNELSPGIYFITITGPTGGATQKIVIAD